MILATQYFRPPFPDRSRWRADLARIRATGFTHIYSWATWSWVEAEPDRYRFDDYDELFELAAANDLKVIVNTIAELQPPWIHREVPGAQLVDHTGRSVTSSTLSYSNTGIMPGACLDHPAVADRSGRFLTAFAERYQDADALAAWDCWNEMRWASQSDGYVCYCPKTIERFRGWLAAKYGDLNGVADAWRRRITSWEDVVPGRVAGRSFVELLEFQAFLTARASEQLRDRYQRIRAADAARPIVAHTAFPATYFTGTGFLPFEQALARGNDWDLAEVVDGFGCSQFPTWFDMTPADFGARIESGRSAAVAAGKPYWVAELQGGSHRHGIAATEPITGAVQQRWTWNGYSRGAKAVNYWCWRDEIFGREASGFGIIGDDGYAEDRLAQLARTAGVLRQWNELLDGYQPEPGVIGVVFSSTGYQLDFAQSGSECDAAGPSLQGYLHALERLQLPYRVVESHRPGSLDELRLIIVPWGLIIEPELAAALTEFVERGGLLLLEAETDGYDRIGFYRYPDERPFMTALGLRGTGRRPIREPELTVELGARTHALKVEGWLEIFADDGVDVLAKTDRGPAVVSTRLGAGEIIAVGTHAGQAYEHAPYPGFEEFVRELCTRAGVAPSWRCSIDDGNVIQWRFGHSGDTPLLFVTNAGPATRVSFTVDDGRSGGVETAHDLESGTSFALVQDGDSRRVDLELAADDWRVLRLA